MALNNLPAALQAAIQQGYLEREFQDSLWARLGFRDVADREAFSAGIGESVTKSRPGLLPAITTPLATAANTDITNGLTAGSIPMEQYTLTVDQYAGMLDLNLRTSKVAIADVFLLNAGKLAEQAARSVDTLARRALFDAYMGGNTRVRVALGANGPAIQVDDVRGFAAGQAVTVAGNAYTVLSVAVDGSNLSTAAVAGGRSGTITMTGSVTAAHAALNAAVVAGVAPVIVRPSSRASTATLVAGDALTASMILNAKAQHEANNVPTVGGRYKLFIDPIHAASLYADGMFQNFMRGQNASEEYKRGVIGSLLGVDLVVTNQNPVQDLGGNKVRRAILCGQGALVEGVFTDGAYADDVEKNGTVTVVDGIAHVTRAPIDNLQQVVTQSWAYIGGFVAPTDKTIDPSVLPTANSSALKRAIVLETL